MMVESFLNSFGNLFSNASKSSTFFVLFAIYATIQDQFQISPVHTLGTYSQLQLKLRFNYMFWYKKAIQFLVAKS